MSSMLATLLLAAALTSAPSQLQPGGDWATDSIWYDGLVEKATYDATKVIYGQPRQYEATFLTNKEAHELSTLTKAPNGGETVEVWKHNQIEVVPTPNYDYKFVTTSHATTDGLELTRLDASSQEWCGTSVKQYLHSEGAAKGGGWDYFGFSYMPGEGQTSEVVGASRSAPTVAFNSLPLVLRGYDFDGRGDLQIRMLPDQKSNRQTPAQPVDAVVSYAGETDAGHKLTLTADGAEVGTFEFADDRRHVMLSYEGVNGDSYQLIDLDRVDYWTRDE